MSPTTDLAASLLEAGASGYASSAAGRLAERPEVAAAFGEGAFVRWKEHLSIRLRELAASLVVSEPELFVSDVVWSRTTFEARETPLDLLRASLEELGAVLAEELPEGSRETPLEYVKAASEALDALPAEPGGPTDEADEADEADGAGDAAGDEDADGLEKLALVYLEAALSGDRRRALDLLLAAVDDGMMAETVHQRVLTIAQQRAGEMWHRWEIGVAQEHFVTSTTRTAMALLAQRFEIQQPRDKTAVIAVVPGNGHELAAQALADFFERDGWRTIYLGGQLPAAELALATEIFEADLLALSVALSTQVRGTLEVVRKVRSRRPDIRLLLGGGVVGRAPQLWRKLGGDGSAQGYGEALSVANQLVG